MIPFFLQEAGDVLKYTLKRLLQSLLTVLLIVSIVFLLMRLLPTDYYFREDELMKFTEEQKHDRLEAEGLLDPPLVQLGNFFRNMFQYQITKGKSVVKAYALDQYISARLKGETIELAKGQKAGWVFNLGMSRRISAGQPVQKVIAEKMGVSMQIGLISLAISLVLGVVLGVLQARNKGGLLDNIGTGYTVFINAVPHLVSYSLILIFGNQVLGLPAVYKSRDPATSLIMPVVCLALASTAGYMLWMRRYMVDELNKDYIRLAKLKGLSATKVMFRHVLRNAFVPLAQYLPYSILLTVGGSLLVESFFAIPGMGPLLSNAIPRYDLNLVQAIVMFYASLGVIGVFLGDILMCLFDPRIKLTGKGDVR